MGKGFDAGPKVYQISVKYPLSFEEESDLPPPRSKSSLRRTILPPFLFFFSPYCVPTSHENRHHISHRSVPAKKLKTFHVFSKYQNPSKLTPPSPPPQFFFLQPHVPLSVHPLPRI